MRGAFAARQTYVALSRTRSEEVLTPARPVRAADLIVDERVVEFSGAGAEERQHELHNRTALVGLQVARK